MQHALGASVICRGKLLDVAQFIDIDGVSLDGPRSPAEEDYHVHRSRADDMAYVNYGTYRVAITRRKRKRKCKTNKRFLNICTRFPYSCRLLETIAKAEPRG